MPRLILASASPRRRELLGLLRLPFEVRPVEVDEDSKEILWIGTRPHSIGPRERADGLARLKAWECWHDQRTNAIVIGADTIVSSDRPGILTALGKPADGDDARRMLRMLSGTTHTVYTGVALAYPEPDPPCPGEYLDCDLRSEIVDTQVTFRELTSDMIDAYIATGEPFDKAGAYGIQGYASAFVEAIYGDYFNVVGLPIHTVAKMLEKIGIEWWRGEESLGERT